MRRQVINRKRRLLGIGRRNGLFVGMINRTVFGQQFRLTITRVVWMGKPEIDQERIRVLCGLALIEIIQHLLRMPGTPPLIGVPTTGAVMAYLKKIIGARIAIAILAGTHGVVAGLVEDCGQSVLNQIGWNHLWIVHVRIHDPAGLVRNMPNCAPAHNHVPRSRANAAHP